MLAKTALLFLIFSSSSYAIGSDCAKALKATSSGKVADYNKPSIGFSSNPSEALQVNILKSKIIVEASREAAEKHAVQFLISKKIDLKNSLELTLFTNFTLGVRDRHLRIYNGATPQIEVKQDSSSQSEQVQEPSIDNSELADFFDVSADASFQNERKYIPAFVSSKFPVAIKNAADKGLIQLTNGASFEQLEESLTPINIEASIQQIAAMIYNQSPAVAEKHLKKIFNLSKEVNSKKETLIGVNTDHSENINLIEEMISHIQDMNAVFANSKNYLLASLSGAIQFSQQDYQDANFDDFNAFAEILFDGSANENSFKKMAYEIAIAKMQTTSMPDTIELTSQAYNELKEEYDLIYKAPLRIFESYAKPDKVGFDASVN